MHTEEPPVQYEIGYNDGINGYSRHPILADNSVYREGFEEGRYDRNGAKPHVWWLFCAMLGLIVLVVIGASFADTIGSWFNV